MYLQEAEPQRGKDDSFMIPKWEFRFRSHQSTAFLLFTFPLVLHTTLLITYFSLDCVFFLFSLLFLVSQSCLTLCDTHGLQPTRLLSPWEFSRQVCWSGLPSPPPGIFPTQGSNPGLLHYRWILY